MARSVSSQAGLESIGNYPEAETLANKPEKQGVRHIRGVGSGNFSDTTSAISLVRALVERIAPSIAPNFYTESSESVMDELSAVFVSWKIVQKSPLPSPDRNRSVFNLLMCPLNMSQKSFQ